MSGCVPVVVTYTSDYPFGHILDYTRFALFVPPVLAARNGFLLTLLRNSKKLWTHKHLEILRVGPNEVQRSCRVFSSASILSTCKIDHLRNTPLLTVPLIWNHKHLEILRVGGAYSVHSASEVRTSNSAQLIEGGLQVP